MKLSTLNLDRRKWLMIIGGLMLVRLVMATLLLFDIPRLDYHVGWAFYHGGDEVAYYRVADAIANNKVLNGLPHVGAGGPLLIALAIKLTGATEFEPTLIVLAPLNGFVLATLCIAIFAALTYYLTQSYWQSLCVAMLWTFSPYIFWLLFLPHPQVVKLQSAYVARQFWMNGLTDAPAMFVTLLGWLLVVWIYQQEALFKRNWFWYVLVGVVFGLGLTIRIHILASIVPIFAALLFVKRWREFLLLCAGTFAGFLVQVYYNLRFSEGGIWDTPYIRNWLRYTPAEGFVFQYNNTPFAPQFLWKSFLMLTRNNVFFMVLAVLAVVVLGYAFVKSWQRHGALVALSLVGVPALTFAVHVSTFVFVDDPLRFTLPGLTLGLPLIVWTVFIFVELIVSQVQKRISSQ